MLHCVLVFIYYLTGDSLDNHEGHTMQISILAL